ncbi:interferon gamma 1-like [Xiphophorus hellerii]|uniref:interferon gamma 1-like n=1 Tax=Xiphophorus hellerii TaxID=8084 RepID=UPI0013B3FDE0|nr:interferon gamma 1-like [Xiphophorus hellerii]
MPSCSVLLGLLVLLEGVLAYALPLQAVSEKLKESHESIATDLGLTQLEINRDPLFDFIIRTINTSCQRKEDMQLMNATLDVYLRVFSHVRYHHGNHLLDRLSEPKRTEVIKHLAKLENKAKELKSRLICQNQNIEDALSELERIKVDDPMVQKKALAQFLQIYQAASAVAESNAASAK